MMNNINRIRNLINQGEYPDLAARLQTNNVDLDALVAEESCQMVEISRLINSGRIIDPIPKFTDLPYGFTTVEREGTRGIWRATYGKGDGLLVIASIAIYENLAWYHVSFSRSDRLPDYKDIRLIKDNWFGDNRWAIQVHPKASEHVNIAKNCLHLWSCLESEFKLPDFRSFGAI